MMVVRVVMMVVQMLVSDVVMYWRRDGLTEIDDIDLFADHAALFDVADLQLPARQGKQGQLLADKGLWHAQVEERSERHVAREPGCAVKIQGGTAQLTR
jgi:hypothetical protein